MLAVLQKANEKIISLMKKQQGILGSWYFGSVAHEMEDEYSDIDIVFLAEDAAFEEIDCRLKDLLTEVVDKVVIHWAEEFNNDRIKNYDFILMLDGQIFQYDVFLLNKAHLDDFMCRIHYTNLQVKDIIFDIHGEVKKLVETAPKGNYWTDDIDRLTDTYWLHVQMSVKYFLRKDFFKLEGVLRILMDTHTSLLLIGFDTIRWGGSANKLHFISSEKQAHLKKYGCMEDFTLMQKNLWQSIAWFEEDVAEIGTSANKKHSEETAALIKEYWITKTEDTFR